MYKTIYVPVDNSDHSNCAVDLGVMLARRLGARVIGSHVYAARMHERRFKQMEAGLPEEYHEETVLERQRKIHDSLIFRGLQIITDSYLDRVERACSDANLPFERRTLEGKNYKALAEDIATHRYDLVVMGAFGLGAVSESDIGSVCERVVRRVRSSDILVTKHTQPMNGGGIMVALDGSPHAFGGLRTAVALGQALGVPVDVVAAFDPYFHYAAFHSIGAVLSEEAGRVFRFREQEKLHEEIIDSGLAKIYQSQLDIARDIARSMGSDITTSLLDGKPMQRLLQRVKQSQPWLLVMGRVGIHSDQDLDIGSTTERLLREAPCHVLISNQTYTPPLQTAAQHTVVWSEEAAQRMARMGMPTCAKVGIMQYAIEQGHSVITTSVMDAAITRLMPGGHGVAAEGPAAAARQVYRCGNCGHVVKDEQPHACPVCGAIRERFTSENVAALQAGRSTEGPVTRETAFDGMSLEWTRDARELLQGAPTEIERRRLRAEVEKSARRLGLTTITKAICLPFVAP